MAIERYTNKIATTLNGGINNSVTTLTVTSSTGFPTTGLFSVVLGTEYLTVTGISGTTWTVVRGAEGSTAASHLNGDTITHIQTARSFDQRFLDQISVGAYSALPSENKAGRLFIPSDGYGQFYNNGSGWLNYGPWGQMYPPDDSQFSWVNQGSASPIIVQGSGLILWGNSQAGLGMNIRAKPLAFSAPYTVNVGLFPSTTMTDNTSFGICLLDNTNKLVMFGVGINATNVTYLFENHMNSPTSFSANVGLTRIWPSSPLWLQVRDDGAGTRFFALRSDNLVTYDVFSEASNTWITPTKVGFYVDPNFKDVITTCISFQETTP